MGLLRYQDIGSPQRQDTSVWTMQPDGTLIEQPANDEQTSADSAQEARAFGAGAIAVGRIEHGRCIGSVRLNPRFLDTGDDRLMGVLDGLHERYPDVLWYVFDHDSSVPLAA